MRESLQYVDQLADYLLDASDKMQQVRMGKTRGHLEYSRTRCLHQHSSSVYPLAGTRLEHGLRSLRKLSKELECLQTACFVLIAFATGMRLSELLSLREGCCEVETQSGRPALVWIHSRVFKMQGRARRSQGKVVGRAPLRQGRAGIGAAGKKRTTKSQSLVSVDAHTGKLQAVCYANSAVRAFDLA